MSANTMSEPIRDVKVLPVYKRLLLGGQHLFTLFGASVLVPILTGMDISVALFMGGCCTLVFHLVTKGKVPVYLGSSFAFIGPVIAATTLMGGGAEGLAHARGGLVVAGIIHVVVAGIIYLFGADKMSYLFPPVVTGPMIMSIGFILAPTAVSMASENWWIALLGFALVVAITIYGKGFIQIVPVLIAMFIGYLISMACGMVDLSIVAEAKWLGLPNVSMPKFDMSTIMLVAPVALATMVEHIGDVAAIGNVVRKDFYKDPGLHRTMLGDGIATTISGFCGGPALTTYSENTGVLALTRIWDPVVMRIAACFAICLGFSPKIAAILQTIPGALIGGISIILFGFLAGTGLRTMASNKINFTNSRNLIIIASIAVLALGQATIPIKIGAFELTLVGMPVAAIVGMVLNLILPKRGDEYTGEPEE